MEGIGKPEPLTGDLQGEYSRRINDKDRLVYHMENGSYQFEICDEKGRLCALLQSNPDFSDCVCALVAEHEAGKQFGLNNAVMLVYAFASAPYGTLLMHASVIRNNGTGYLFLGKSGTGKSTHTRLWLRYIPGSDLMNDDNPVVRVMNGQAYVFGSPWSGKTPCYKTNSYELVGCVRLSQAPYNEIKKLKVMQAYAALHPSCPPDFAYDEKLYDCISQILNDILVKVPVYHLACLPNAEAAHLSCKTIFGV